MSSRIGEVPVHLHLFCFTAHWQARWAKTKQEGIILSAAEFELKIHEKEGIAYIPKKLREQYGLRPIILPNDTAAAMYPSDAKLTEVIRSLEVLIQHLKLRVDKEAEKE